MEDGYWGVVEWLGELSGQLPAGADGASLASALNCAFAKAIERLPRSAGATGPVDRQWLVEAPVKQLLRRLKQTGPLEKSM